MSIPTPTHKCDTEHQVLNFVHVGKMLATFDSDHSGAMEMKRKTPLAKALDSMSDIPFLRLPADVPKDVALTVAGVDAGTLHKPKVDVILEKSTESSFGRGSETVLDPSYRRGREIPAADMSLRNLQGLLLPDIKRVMFPGREVELKLYKLAIYEPGGHFDWHMDSTHSDKHHGTLLLALNTSWTGGNLMLRRNGIETPVDLRPQRASAYGRIKLQAVAFFTDTEHRVEPVESGTRIVLQYDVELFKKRENGKKAKEEGDERDKEGNENEDEDGDGDDDGEEEEADGEDDTMMDNLERGKCERRGVAEAKADQAALKKVLSIIKGLHNQGTQEVAFALQHLYRSESILAEYLKGSDATLYNALLASGDFDVSLHPVIFSERTDYEGTVDDHHVYRFGRDKDQGKDEDDDDDDESPQPRKKRKLGEKGPSDGPPLFHIPELSGFIEISRQEYVEHTGNQAMPAQYRYFGGGVFVRPKAT